MASDDVQTNLRLPADLKDRLTASASANNRSLSAEATSRLEQTFADEAASNQRLGVEAALAGVQVMMAFHLRQFFSLLPTEEQAKPINQIVRDMARAIGHGSAEQIEESLATYFGTKDRPKVSQLATTLHTRREFLDKATQQMPSDPVANEKTLSYLKGEPKK